MNAPVNDPVNLGNPRELTLLELAEARSASISGSKSEIVYRPLPVDDPKVRQPDISRARRLLDWEPTLAVEEGLRQTIEWYRRPGRPLTRLRKGARPMIDEELRAILACPACKGELIFEETRIICPACRKAYPVRDGIPVMLIGEAEPWTPKA